MSDAMIFPCGHTFGAGGIEQVKQMEGSNFIKAVLNMSKHLSLNSLGKRITSFSIFKCDNRTKKKDEEKRSMILEVSIFQLKRRTSLHKGPKSLIDQMVKKINDLLKKST
ncbi:hypothetical protein YC2023_082319 [Brassica napus]